MTIFNSHRLRRAAAVLLLLAVFGGVACGQGRGRGKGLRDNLPGPLQQIPKSQYGLLDQLLDEALHTLGGGELPAPGFDEVGNFFGRVHRQPREAPPAGIEPPAHEPFGLFVMGGLGASQVRQLSDLARTQLDDFAQYQRQHAALLAKVAEAQAADRPSRALEREAAEMSQQLGQREARMGLAQANGFLELRRTLTDDQLEYMLLLRRTPDAASPDHPNVMKIREAAERLSPAHREAVMALAERACLYLTGAAPQNLPSLQQRRLPEPESEDARRKMALLNSLHPPQLSQLAAMLAAEGRMSAEIAAKRLQIAVMLDTLKAERRLDERKLDVAAGQLGELRGRTTAFKQSGLKQFADSLSVAQKAFITTNLLPPKP